MTFRVDSEVGQLRRAIIHRPGLELSRLTPDNIGELLFDDVMWAKKARRSTTPSPRRSATRVQVHYYGQLLAETLEVPDGRAFILDRLCTPETPRDRRWSNPCGRSSKNSTGSRWLSIWWEVCSKRTYTLKAPTASSGTCFGPTTSF
jgi:hypothetical protein